MTRIEALQVLIKSSHFLSASDKEKLSTAIPTMSGEDVDALGVFLAVEQKDAAASRDDILKRIDLILAELDQAEEGSRASGS